MPGLVPTLTTRVILVDQINLEKTLTCIAESMISMTYLDFRAYAGQKNESENFENRSQTITTVV